MVRDDGATRVHGLKKERGLGKYPVIAYEVNFFRFCVGMCEVGVDCFPLGYLGHHSHGGSQPL